MNSLKPQPGQTEVYKKEFHPLPGDWAKMQMEKGGMPKEKSASSEGRTHTELQKALAAERAQHD